MSISRTAIREATEIVRIRPQQLLWFIADLLAANLGTFLLFAAFEAGPVSGASALNATRPLFVFLYVVILSLLAPRFMHEPLTMPALTLKLFSIAMIVGGSARLVTGLSQ